MEKGNSDEARVLAGPAACKRYSGPKPPSPGNRGDKRNTIMNNRARENLKSSGFSRGKYDSQRDSSAGNAGPFLCVKDLL